jgi:molybdenum-dependent DNA-binding transcriptional regulator ModE
LREQFKRVHFEYNHTRNELNSIWRRIADAESLAEDALIKTDRGRKARLDDEIERIGEQIGGLEQANNSLALLIVQKEKQLEDLRKKLTASA